jgi:hypothetical protein
MTFNDENVLCQNLGKHINSAKNTTEAERNVATLFGEGEEEITTLELITVSHHLIVDQW